MTQTAMHNMIWSPAPPEKYAFQPPRFGGAIAESLTSFPEMCQPSAWNLLYILAPRGSNDLMFYADGTEMSAKVNELRSVLVRGLPLGVYVRTYTPRQFVDLLIAERLFTEVPDPGALMRQINWRLRHHEGFDG